MWYLYHLSVEKCAQKRSHVILDKKTNPVSQGISKAGGKHK